MSNIFSGLDKLGLNDIEDVDIFQDKKEISEKKVTRIKAIDVLYSRKLDCPVCRNKILARSVKSGKAKLMSIDTDLRPIYDIIDPNKYDVIMCNKCGYSALNRFFKSITQKQITWIKDNISKSFIGREYPDEYTYEIAIERYKLALLSAVVKKAKASEKAYICLKVSWLLRSYKEERIEKGENDTKVIKELERQELTFGEKAYQGFLSAYENERFPVCGMDEETVVYLLGDLAGKLGSYDEALKWLSKIIISRTASERLKDKARDVKEMIKLQQKDDE